MKKVLILLVSLVSFSGIVYAAAVQPLNGIVAVVNNDIITQNSLDSQMAMMKKQLQMTNQPVPPAAKLRKQTLNQMIDQKLVLQAAAKAKITVTDAQLNAAIANIAQQNQLTVDQLKQQIVKQGMAYSEYQKQIRQQFLINATERQAIGNTIQVSNAEVQAAMKKVPQQIQSIPEYHLQALLVPFPNAATVAQVKTAQDTANNIIQQLQKGADFDSIAVSQSTNAQPLQGGDMGWKQLEQLPPAIGAQMASAVTGSIVGPLQTPNGFYIIKVVATRTVGAPQQAATQSADQIRQTLYFQKFENAAQKWVNQLRSTAYIKIMQG